jgi:hypothetical protein
MEAFSVELSARGIKKIQFDGANSAFEFIVGRMRYETSSFIADFLSPKISSVHSSDPSCASYTVQTPDPMRLFPRFLEMGQGRPLTVDGRTLPFFCALAVELGNLELVDAVWHKVGQTDVHNCCPRLRAGVAAGRSTEDDLRFIAGHFSDVSVRALDALDVEQMRRVFRRQEFRPSSPDRLLEFVMRRYETDRSFAGLLELVDFAAVSHDVLAAFAERGDELFEYLNQGTWDKIFSRLKVPVKAPPSSRARKG